MKVFISWSGDLSNKVALVLRDWIPLVIQTIEPYVSTEDIYKGTRWSTDISGELDASSFGILCVTPTNIDAPWLNFEAGSLAKSVEKSCVAPFLFGVKQSDITSGPLLQFQSTIYKKEDVHKLVVSLNRDGEAFFLEDDKLEKSFERWWPVLEEQLDPLLDEESEGGEVKTVGGEGKTGEILEEILALVRSQTRLLSTPEAIFPKDHIIDIFGSTRRTRTRPSFDHKAMDDLWNRWNKFRDVVNEFAESRESMPPGVLFEHVMELQSPISHLYEQLNSQSLRRKGFVRDLNIR